MKPFAAAAPHILGDNAHGGEHGNECFQAELYGVHRVEYRFLVLLHILVVGEGDALHHREQGHKVAVDAAGLSADELGDVGVLLLRHYRRARCVGVVELDEFELPRAPHYYLLGEAGQVHHEYRDRRSKLYAEISVGNAVKEFPCISSKPSSLVVTLPVYRVGGGSEGTAAERH